MASEAVDRLHSRAKCLADQFEQGGESRCVEEAIDLARQALELCPPGHSKRSISLTWLALHLDTRYSRFGDIEDINDAMSLDREALLLCPPGHSNRSMSLNNLGIRLYSRYNRLGGLDDLDEAITLGRDVLLLCPQGHPGRSISLNNLGSRLSSRHNRLGELNDLDEAIMLSRDALLLCPPGHPGRQIPLIGLGFGLSSRYSRLGGLDDLDEAITLGREALLLCPPGHPGRSRSLNNLGSRFISRYYQLRELGDLDEAIAFGRDALLLCPPGHPGRLMPLIGLSSSLSSRYNRLGGLDDLDEAVTLGREALLLCPPGHPLQSMSLSNLGSYLSSRYNQLGGLDDLDEAITLGRDALLLCPPGHPLRSLPLNNLGSYLFSRYTKLRHKFDQQELFTIYIQLSDVQRTTSLVDFSAARAWVTVAEHSQHSSTLLAYRTTTRFLTYHLATLPAPPQHLANVKNIASSLAVDAFSAGIRNHNLTHAVELLEQGRGIFWGQLARLDSSHELADIAAFGSAGKTLAVTWVSLLIRSTISSPAPNQHDQVCNLNVKLQDIVSEIRRLPHLSRFLLPPTFLDLQQAASGGPIIVVNASAYSCDALIVLVDRDPVHVPLPAVTRDSARDLSSRLRTLTVRAKSANMLQEFGTFLRELWDQVVSLIVDVLRTIVPLQSRIWWCPTAEFMLLPFHAAGPCRLGEQNLPDLYISSYTPTLSALIRARRHVQPKTKRIDRLGQTRFVAIGQANVAGEKELKSVADELTDIGQLLDGVAAFTPIEGTESSISRTIDEFGKSEWVHLACHGIPNEEYPFDSAFALHDGHLTIERIIRCELENPEFAYLSACHTTVGDKKSPDEVLHLTAAMQFVGFRSVIGTMWAVDDGQTRKITSTFYRHLISDSGRLDYTRAALALHLTMKELTGIVPGDQRILYVHIGV